MDGSISTALILGAVALSESIRVTPSGAFVMRRVLAGPWMHIEPLALGRGFSLPSVASPFTVAVVVPPRRPEGEPRVLMDVLRERLDATTGVLTTLRILGAVSLVLLVGGVPLLTARSGWVGLLGALSVLLLLAIAQAVLARSALRRVGVESRAARSGALKLLWPFTTPRSADVVLEGCMSGMPPLVAARVLLPAREFQRAVRPIAYDVVNGRDTGEGLILLALCEVEELRAIIAHPPADTERFCPRCAAGYEPGIDACAECDGVTIVAS